MTERGTVYAHAGGVYSVRLDDGRIVEATLRGRLKRSPRDGAVAVVGDRVLLTGEGETRTVDVVEDRETRLVRSGKGGRAPKIVAANLDRLLVVVPVVEGPSIYPLIDRMLALGHVGGLRPILVLNKVDLPGGGEAAEVLADHYARAGYTTVCTSARTGVGLEALRAVCREGSSALIGPSGAGKTSLLNALDPGLDLRTAELSAKTGTGRHTTVGARMIPLSCGGVVADTPGFGDVALWGVPSEQLDSCFPEFGPYLGECRFRSCTHLHEPGCAVLEAVARGAVSKSRHASYRTLHEESGAPGARS